MLKRKEYIYVKLHNEPQNCKVGTNLWIYHRNMLVYVKPSTTYTVNFTVL